MLLLARSVQGVGTFLLTCLAAASFVQNSQDLPTAILRALHQTAVDYRALLMVATAGCILFAQFVTAWVEKPHGNRKVLQAVVDALHGEYFTTVPEAQKFQHRVTLFRCCK